MLCHQRWSPRGRPWPRGHILKSLASKVKFLASRPQVLENWPVLGSRTARFFVEIAWKVFVKTFFFLESTCACVLGPWPWPRAFLSLASRVSVLEKAVLGLGFFLCPWPWPRALCPRIHLCLPHWILTLRRSRRCEQYFMISGLSSRFLILTHTPAPDSLNKFSACNKIKYAVTQHYHFFRERESVTIYHEYWPNNRIGPCEACRCK